MEWTFLIRCHNNGQRWKYAISTGHFFIRICSIFIFHKNGDNRKLKAWSFRLWNNDFCRLYNERNRALQSPISLFFIQPVYMGLTAKRSIYIGGWQPKDLYTGSWLQEDLYIHMRLTAKRLIYWRSTTRRLIYRGLTAKKLIYRGLTPKRLMSRGLRARRHTYWVPTAKRLIFTGLTAKRHILGVDSQKTYIGGWQPKDIYWGLTARRLIYKWWTAKSLIYERFDSQKTYIQVVDCQ